MEIYFPSEFGIDPILALGPGKTPFPPAGFEEKAAHATKAKEKGLITYKVYTGMFLEGALSQRNGKSRRRRGVFQAETARLQASISTITLGDSVKTRTSPSPSLPPTTSGQFFFVSSFSRSTILRSSPLPATCAFTPRTKVGTPTLPSFLPLPVYLFAKTGSRKMSCESKWRIGEGIMMLVDSWRL